MSVVILAILFLALMLDRIVGDPSWPWQRVRHPVVIFGAAIDALDRRMNRDSLAGDVRRRNGVVAIALLLVGAALAGGLLHGLFAALGLLGFLLEVAVVAVLLAQKSLKDHVAAVADGLRREGLAGGRRAVSMIVGRDPETLDGAGVVRAAIESLAENFADGTVAPAFWYAVAGLPGIFAYKMLNTADSMIGHKSPKYLDFGWASARLDDLANWPAARLSSLLIAAGTAIRQGTAAARRSLSVAFRDSGLHRSPNSGWPEAAMAGALDIRLAGPRIYGGQLVSEPMINGAGRAEAEAGDIGAAIGIFDAACSSLAALVLGLAVIAILL